MTAPGEGVPYFCQGSGRRTLYLFVLALIILALFVLARALLIRFLLVENIPGEAAKGGRGQRPLRFRQSRERDVVSSVEALTVRESGNA